MKAFTVLVATVAILSSARLARAQHAAVDEPVCLGFSFGRWTPSLDWARAGHGARIDSSAAQRAPGDRDWASDIPTGQSDSTLVLFPQWWPVGVGIALPTRTPAPGDTVSGTATAFTAGGDAKSPTSHVRAWRVKCGG